MYFWLCSSFHLLWIHGITKLECTILDYRSKMVVQLLFYVIILLSEARRCWNSSSIFNVFKSAKNQDSFFLWIFLLQFHHQDSWFQCWMNRGFMGKVFHCFHTGFDHPGRSEINKQPRALWLEVSIWIMMFAWARERERGTMKSRGIDFQGWNNLVNGLPPPLPGGLDQSRKVQVCLIIGQAGARDPQPWPRDQYGVAWLSFLGSWFKSILIHSLIHIWLGKNLWRLLFTLLAFADAPIGPLSLLFELAFHSLVKTYSRFSRVPWPLQCLLARDKHTSTANERMKKTEKWLNKISQRRTFGLVSLVGYLVLSEHYLVPCMHASRVPSKKENGLFHTSLTTAAA